MIKYRCYNDNAINYKDYGARGIAVCSEWLHDFQAFYEWSISHGYSDNLTIDRIDANKYYSPNNCQWVDMKQQARNRRSNRNYTINGETHCLMDWCELLNIEYKKVWARLNQLGWNIYDSLELNERGDTD